MRRFFRIIPLLALLFLSACGGGERAEQLALEIRSEALSASACRMEAAVLADYEDWVYVYELSYQWNEMGDSRVTVLAPDTIKGVTAVLSEDGTELAYEGARLDTGVLDGNGLSPMGSLPALLTACREGYIARVISERWGETDALCVTYGDPEPADSVQYQIWYDKISHAPLYGEIVWSGQTVLQCTFHSVAWT